MFYWWKMKRATLCNIYRMLLVMVVCFVLGMLVAIHGRPERVDRTARSPSHTDGDNKQVLVQKVQQLRVANENEPADSEQSLKNESVVKVNESQAPKQTIDIAPAVENVDKNYHTEKIKEVDVPQTPKQTIDVIPPIENAESFSHKSRIPKIIHQFWEDGIIPTEFVENVRGLVRDNTSPEWQYYFWTMKTARNLIKDKHPALLNTFDGYPDNLSRADAWRYVAMYEYGGAYFDMDTVSVKPLDQFINQHVCAFVQEPDEHLLVYNVDYLLTMSVLLCRPRHPFYKFVIDTLPSFLKKGCKNAYTCTGPSPFTQMYIKYQPKPSDYMGIVPTDLLQDMYFKRMRTPQIDKICQNLDKLSKFRRTICETWIARGKDSRGVSENAFTYHTYHYSQRTGPWKSISFKPENNITTIVPHLKMYNSPSTK